MIQAFDYQAKLVDNTIRQFKNHRKVLMQLPTGGGKTVIFSLIVGRYLKKNPDKSIMILVHREELLQQAKKTIESMYDYEVGLIVAGVRSVNQCPVYIGMVESVNTRAHLLDILNLGLVIIDEAHIGNFIKMHDIFTNELVLGVTATPKSQSKKTPMKNYYGTIVVGPQIKELIANKRLSQNITRCPKDIVEEATLEIDIKTGDFDQRQMGNMFKKPKYVSNTYLYYFQYCRGQKTIIFNVNVEHSKEVEYMFNGCGVIAKHIDGTTPKDERAAILKWFKETDNAVLCNVGIANIGFDEPTIQAVIVNLSTLSLEKWLQSVGRGARYIEDKKEHFNVIDLGGNSVRFGDWSDDRDWEYLFWNPEKPGKPGLAPVKICPKCEGLVHAAVHYCPLPDPESGEICNYEFAREKLTEAETLGEMVVMTKGIDVDAIMQEHISKRPYFVFYEMARIIIDQAIKQTGGVLTNEMIAALFDGYIEKVKEWHKKQFPKKRFTDWHRTEGYKHFMDIVNLRLTHITKLLNQ